MYKHKNISSTSPKFSMTLIAIIYVLIVVIFSISIVSAYVEEITWGTDLNSEFTLFGFVEEDLKLDITNYSPIKFEEFYKEYFIKNIVK